MPSVRITTVFDALRVGSIRSDNLVHSPYALPLAPDHGVRLVSLMDHMPDQRQFRDLSKLKEYEQGRYGTSDAKRVGRSRRQSDSAEAVLSV